MNDSVDPVAESNFPTATLVRKASAATRLSKWWLLTLACLVLAVVLAWMSSAPRGIPISIRFDQGHGLKVGDTIRHRGIDVGVVEAVELTGDLNAIEVSASLSPEAGAIAVADSRFWIVRPRIEMDGVSGLDTAIGAKYVRVIPGRSLRRQEDFLGLSVEPTDIENATYGEPSQGLEILLRATRRKGVYASAPVTYRGVQVGQVLSVGLSPDAEFVDIRARIDESYRRLVRESSLFWIASGFDIDVGITGVSV